MSRNVVKWPRKVQVGNVIVKVYRRIRANGSHGFEVADYSNGVRRLRSFPDEASALKEGEKIARLLAAGDVQAAQMKNGDAASYGRAVELLRPTGVALEIAAAHFAEAFKILGGDKIVHAAEFYKERAPDSLTRRTVLEVVSELLASKEGKRTENTISDLRARLTTFAESFKVDAPSVTTPDVQRWLDGLKVSERTQLNYRNKVFQLFKFAERRGYIPKRSNPVADTERPEPPEGTILIYAPDEITRLLRAASPEFMPCIALGAFAGLRSGELQRLNWQDIELHRGHITAVGRKRGTPSRRIIPILPNLKQWLTSHAKRSGPVWKGSEDDFGDAQQDAAAATEVKADTAKGIKARKPVKWKHNALRHSFISYRLAAIQNTNQVALEAGNSATTIFKHYRELVTESDAKAWFAIVPEVPAKITV